MDIWACAKAVDPLAPLVVLHSAGHGPWSSRSLCAVPEGVLRIECGGARWIGDSPHPAGVPPSDPLAALAWADSARDHATSVTGAPAAGGWVAVLHYELGELLEPAVCGGTSHNDGHTTPLADLLWCPNVTCVQGAALPGGEPLQQCGPAQSQPSADAHLKNVERTIEYICAGDVFQANIARRISVDVEGNVLLWAQHAITANCAPFGAFIRLPGNGVAADRVITSVSPELFLDVTADNVITSRPIKGTAGSDEAVALLESSSKDTAELHMIVDLVRNDLSRVCRPGTVSVRVPRAIETHATVHHGVAEVCGQVRDDVGLVDLLRATFPPGSVTGAPKIRAMQIIRELEMHRRGPYCGAIGLLGPHGATMLSVGIRTSSVHGTLDGDRITGTLNYGTGGGITAQSDPAAEVDETNVKLEALRSSLDRMSVG